MSASFKTKLQAAQFDYARRDEGITGNLALYKTDTAGYALLATIETGWRPQTEKDTIEGTRTMVVTIELTDENAAILTTSVTTHCSALAFMGRRFVVQDRAAPFGDPAEWVFRCDPTGETV